MCSTLTIYIRNLTAKALMSDQEEILLTFLLFTCTQAYEKTPRYYVILTI